MNIKGQRQKYQTVTFSLSNQELILGHVMWPVSETVCFISSIKSFLKDANAAESLSNNGQPLL